MPPLLGTFITETTRGRPGSADRWRLLPAAPQSRPAAPGRAKHSAVLREDTELLLSEHRVTGCVWLLTTAASLSAPHK